MRATNALAALTLLGGCWWQGPAFYTPDPAAPAPITAGLYEGKSDDGKVETHRIVRLPDGSFGPGPGEPQEQIRVMFKPLAIKGRDLWASQMSSADPKKAGALYGLVERRGEIIDLLPTLDCKGNEALVRTAGGMVEIKEAKDGGPACVFGDAPSLERALTAFANANPRLEEASQIRRTGD